jgi:hypothetical protein
MGGEQGGRDSKGGREGEGTSGSARAARFTDFTAYITGDFTEAGIFCCTLYGGLAWCTEAYFTESAQRDVRLSVLNNDSVSNRDRL